MKLVTLDKLQRFYENLVGTYDTELNVESSNPIINKAVAEAIEELRQHALVPIDPDLIENESITKEKLDQAIQDALDRIAQLENIEETLRDLADAKDYIDGKADDLNDAIEEIETIIAGNKAAIEAAQAKTGTLEQALANSVANIEAAQTELAGVKASVEAVDTKVDNLTIDKNNAAQEIAALKAKADANDTNVAGINDKLTTVQTALDSNAAEIAKVKTDLGALDGLTDIQEKVQAIEEIVDDLEKDDLTNYVKQSTLKDSIVTTIAEVGVIDEDTKKVNFYTKEETASQLTTTLADYTRNDDLSTTLNNYYTKTETPEAVKTQLVSSGLVDGTGKANVYTKAETANSIAASLSEYTDNVLSNYSTQAATSQAITDAVGDLNLNQYSTVTQTAGAIETAISDFDNNNIKKNYYDKTETAEYVSSQMNSYVNGKLKDYSTTEQTAQAIQTAVAEASLDGELSNYSTTEQTAQAIKTAVTDNNKNYSTTEQTAATINKAIKDNNGNYYDKTETATQIKSALQEYETSDGVDAKLKKYSTLAQTADEIKAELYSAGLTTSATNLTRAVLTADEVKTTVSAMAGTGGSLATKTEVQQTALGIQSTVAKIQDNVAKNASTITQLDSAIGLAVTNNKLDGSKLVTAINVGDGSIAIDGKYVHVTGDTVFDEDVIIKGIIDCEKGVTVKGGAVTLDSKGLTVKNSSGGSMVLDSNGMNFKDSNGKVFSQLGRFAVGTCKHGEVVKLGWDVVPKTVMLTPYTIQSGVAGYTGSNIYTKCFAESVTKDSFTCKCYTTIAAGSYATQTIAAKTLSESRSASGTGDVTKSLTSATITAPAGSTQTTLTGQIIFRSGYNTSHDAAVTSTNASLSAPAGSTLTVTASPASAQYEVSAVNIAAATGSANSSNYYTATLGTHTNVNITMSANTNVDWNRAGFRKAYIDIYVGSSIAKTVTVYVGSTSYGKVVPSTSDSAYQLNEVITHSTGATIKIVARADWSWKVDSYKIEQGAITCTSNVSGDTVISTGTASYLCLG